MRAALTALLVVAAAAAPARAERVFAAPGPRLIVRRESSETVESGGRIRTTIRLAVVNPGQRAGETEVDLARPRGAVVVGLEVTRGDERRTGLIVERKTAGRVRDGVVLEVVDPERLRLVVRHVPAGATVRVTYAHVEPAKDAPPVAPHLDAMAEQVRAGTGLSPAHFLSVIDAHGYRADDPAVAAVVERSQAIGLLSPFTAFLVRPDGIEDPTKDRGLGRWTDYRATDALLRWLAVQQAADGSWSRDSAMNRTDNPDGDCNLTALALTAFLRVGETHKTGEHRNAVKLGLRYLKQMQDPEGCFGPRRQEFMRTHARAALAMAEAYALTGSPLFKQSVQSAVDFIAGTQNGDGGWSPDLRGPSTTSITAAMVSVLVAARGAGNLDVDRTAMTRARAFLDAVTDEETGRASETPGSAPGPAGAEVTGAALWARILLGADPEEDARARLALERCLEARPSMEGDLAPLAWRPAAAAIWHHGGEDWRPWCNALRRAVAARVHFGAIRPGETGADDLGVVGTTALTAIAVATLHRYLVSWGPR